MAYPDSVNLVNPPQMTIPNTLAALPSNQYATLLLLVSGHEDFLAIVPAASALTPCANAEICEGACVDWKFL